MANSEITRRIEKELMFEYGEEKSKKLFSYLDMILERNEHINLTAVKDRDEAVIKHIVDSLTITSLPEFIAANSVIDVGTGGGFPGVPLAITAIDKNFVLMDATLKRLKVINEFAEKLEINNISTLHARAEEVARKEEYAGKFDLCVSRAVANLPTLLQWSLPFVRKDGYFVAYKGENYQEEIDAAKGNLKKLGGKIDRIVEISSNYENISGHVLIVIKKTK